MASIRASTRSLSELTAAALYGSYDAATLDGLRRLGMLMVLWSVERAKHPRFVTVPQLLRDDPPPAGRRAPQVRIDER